MARFIVRIPSTLLPNGPPPSDIRDTTYTVEAADVFGLPNGETRSKHYSNQRLLDWFYTGATGNGVGIFMMRDPQEGGSGGPFYRCLINQCGSDQEIYDIINYVSANGTVSHQHLERALRSCIQQRPPAGRTAGLFVARNRRLEPDQLRPRQQSRRQLPARFQACRLGSNRWSGSPTRPRNTGPRQTPAFTPTADDPRGIHTATLYKQELAVATAAVTVSAGVQTR